MNALSSYIRHLFVTGILLAVEKFKLPIEGAEDAANALSLILIGTLSWLFAKYAAPYMVKKPNAMLLLVAAIGALTLPSCTGYQPSPEDLARAIEAAGYISQRVVESSGK
jgi:hypothetical protein